MEVTMETTMQPAVVKTVHGIFESVECSRCYGRAGAFQRFGHVANGKCFKCMGTLRHFTKHGQADYDRFRSAVDAVTLRPWTDVKVGDAIKLSDFRRYYTVAAISEAMASHRSGKTETDGTVTWTQHFQVEFKLNKVITVAMPCVGSYTSDTWNHNITEPVRIHAGDRMPKPEDFVTPKRARRTKGAA